MEWMAKARGRTSARQRFHSWRRASHTAQHMQRGSHFNVALASTTAAATALNVEEAVSASERLRDTVMQIRALPSTDERTREVLARSARLPRLLEHERTVDTRVVGCASNVWLSVDDDGSGSASIRGESDSAISRGLIGVVADALSGLPLEEVASVQCDLVSDLGLSQASMPRSRANGALNMLQAVKGRANQILRQQRRAANAACRHNEMEHTKGNGDPSVGLVAGDSSKRKRCSTLKDDEGSPFPSLTVTANSTGASGTFAEMQERFLHPSAESVESMASVLAQKHVGVVAHFYMDPEVQGVLAAAKERWPHIHISDSLAMADAAVRMVEAGCTSVCVLGVDFMSENVRAILDEAGYGYVNVYRMASESIGCSLADAADSSKYASYLQQAAEADDPLHVIYINTSLRVKANAEYTVPTITCTSSNVVATILQAAYQAPGCSIWFGPDTYMGENIRKMLHALVELDDGSIQQLHSGHTAQSVQDLLQRLHTFNDGTCIVHDMFGEDVCKTVKELYADAYMTAHFEVPGEMFNLALEAQRRGMGVVGSTSNLLNFIDKRVRNAVAAVGSGKQRLRFMLGTESGMVTSIVNMVKQILHESDVSDDDVEVEIVFPVNNESINAPEPSNGDHLDVLPGPAAGEGCSSEGGCASCPYMKMNNIDALRRVLSLIGTDGEPLLELHKPRAYSERMSDGRTVAQAGCTPIMRMRHFAQHQQLPQELVSDIRSRHGRKVATASST